MTSVQFDYPSDMSFDCSKCGLCCGDTSKKIRHVLLLKSDAQKIAEHTNQSVSQFAHETGGKSPYIFEMHKNPNGRCVFLKDDQCTIYELRPLICRFYPVELTADENGKPVFRVTLECPGICCMNTIGVGKKLDETYFRALFELAQAELTDASN